MKIVRGHLEARTQLAGMLAEGRFPHAILLHGPQGMGKRVLADALMARLICGPVDGALGAGPSEDAGVDLWGELAEATGPALGADPLACQTESPAWHQLEAGSCPDAYVLTPDEGKKSIGVKAVQTLLESLLRSADTARVVIVDSLEDLTTEAANTLLKTLEEPRRGIYFVLLAHQLSAVLPTIRSRCRLMRLSTLSEADVRAVLQDAGGDPDFAPLAGGCPGRVLGPAAAALMALHTALDAGTAPAAQAPHAVDAMAQALALRGRGWAAAEAYRTLMELKRKAATLNLPLATLNEAAYAVYQKVQPDTPHDTEAPYAD